MKKRTMFLLPLLVILIAAGGLLGCRPSPLDEEGDFTLGARLLAFADKSYVGWEEVSGAAGYKLYRNVGLDNYDDFAEGVDGSKLISDNDQGEEDVAYADEYAEDYLNEDTDKVEFPEFIYYKVFAYDADDAVIAESNIATVFSHLSEVENISYKTDVEEIEISWDKLTDDDTYTILGYQVYRYDSSKDSHARNIPLGKVEQGANPTFTVTDAKRTKQWNYYIAPYDEIGVSATSSGGRVYADLPGPLVTQTHDAPNTEIDVTWPAVKGEINDTLVTGYNVYLAYKSGGMSSSYLKYETTGYDEGETGDALGKLNSSLITGTSFTYDYDAAGVDPYDSLAGGESYDYYFIVQAVSSAGESANYSKYEFNDPVTITK